ncbi:uncharacterized protein LOC143020304 isoform X2 [Oratosquilla oratoria]|uniref:uncharacterized protein LOC143020304 isoform X2 n=1 Tax=Oratosquilla oratoria TaxID=337810 RepID=UPI003F774420
MRIFSRDLKRVGGTQPPPPRLTRLEEKVDKVIEDLESRLGHMNTILQRVERLEELEKANKNLTDEIEDLKRQLREVKVENEELKKNSKENRETIAKESKNWKKTQEGNKVSFTDIVKQQLKEHTEDSVIKVMRQKENIVRDLADKKKCIIILGMEEKHNTDRTTRIKEENEKVSQLLESVQEDEPGIMKQIEEKFRLGKYSTDKTRPIKIKFKSQTTAENILSKTGKLATSEQYKKIWIKREMNKEEREEEKQKRLEAKTKNENRTESEKERFYWRVVNMKLRKFDIQKKNIRETENTMEVAEN